MQIKLTILCGQLLAASVLSVAGENFDVQNDVFGGKAEYECFIRATSVTATRLHKRSFQDIGSDTHLGELGETEAARHTLLFYRKGTTVNVRPEDASRLQTLVTTSDSFTWLSRHHADKMCDPKYSVMFTFSGECGTVSIALCFDCNQIAVLAGPKDDPVSMNIEENVDPIRRQLLEIVGRVFPDMQTLAKSSEQEEGQK